MLCVNGDYIVLSHLITTRGKSQMSAKSVTKSNREVYLDTLQGLQTLIEMQQTLILQAIDQLDKPLAASKESKSRSGSGRKRRRV